MKERLNFVFSSFPSKAHLPVAFLAMLKLKQASCGSFGFARLSRLYEQKRILRKRTLMVLLVGSFAMTGARAQTVGAETVDTTRQVTLQEVTVSTSRQGMLQNRTSLGQLETINRSGLTKMACCTLSASFENTATTQTSYSDAVTGTRQIQMLGLSGIYTQTMAENIPTLRILGYVYGWDYTPAAWLDGISISKGAGTVVNGYEGITGQINLDYRKPNEGQPVYLDLYTDTHLHNEINAVLNHQFSPKLFTGLFLHTTQTTMPERWHKQMDGNGDGFMDMPKVHNYNVYNRWLYADEDHGVQSRLDVRFAFDQRQAGQMDTQHLAHRTLNTPLLTAVRLEVELPSLYQVATRNLNFQASNKTGISIGTREGQSLGIVNSITFHGLRTDFGLKTLDADQKSYYGNLIFNSDLGKNHKYQVGATYQFDYTTTHYAEDRISTFMQDGKEVIASSESTHIHYNPKVSDYGLFAEYTNTQMKDFTLQAGLRADYLPHYGWLFTPRLNVKYNPTPWLVARFSAGRGYRVANPFIENIGLMASARQYSFWQFDNHATLEDAWNIGGNLIFTIPIWNRQEATLSLDYYHVYFHNRLISDLDFMENDVFVYRDRNHSHTDTWQVDLSMPLVKRLTLYAAWRYTLQSVSQKKAIVERYDNGSYSIQFINDECYQTSVPLVPTYKALLNLQYATAMQRWIVDATLQLNGRTRLPGHYDYAQNTVMAEHSPAYALLYAQITKRFRHLDVYVGGENLLSYKQSNPILGWDEPFSDRFDASQVWAPITGAKFYAGLRINLGQYK